MHIRCYMMLHCTYLYMNYAANMLLNDSAAEKHVFSDVARILWYVIVRLCALIGWPPYT